MLNFPLRRLELQASIIGLVVVTLACLGLFSVLHFLIFPGFIRLEGQEAQQNIQRINNAIAQEIRTLDTTNLDWANWDDTIVFIETADEGFLKSNLIGNIVEDLNLHYLQFLTLDAENRWQGSTANLTKADITELDRLIQLTAEDSLLDFNARKGLVSLAGRPFILSLRPVLTSTGKGPNRGLVVMGKFVDIDALQEQTKVIFSLSSLSKKQSEAMLSGILAEIKTGNLYPIRKTNQHKFAMHALLKDINGKEAFILHTTYPRVITNQGLRLVNNAMFFSTIGALALLILYLFLLSRVILNPIHSLTIHVRKIIQSQDYSKKIGMGRKDDIGLLATAFDQLLAKIQVQTNALITANKQLEDMTLTDPLTEIANRRKLDIFLAEEWIRLSRQQEPMTLIMADIDHFKLYNDSYGHDKGDTCLKRVARILAACCHRPADLVSRFGGEEFVILLPDTDSKGGQRVASNMCQALIAEQIEHKASLTAPFVTMSLGVATITPNDKQDGDTLLKAADDALYNAKNQGRNQVSVAALDGT